MSTYSSVTAADIGVADNTPSSKQATNIAALISTGMSHTDAEKVLQAARPETHDVAAKDGTPSRPILPLF